MSMYLCSVWVSTTEYSNAKLKLNRFCTENQRRCNTCMQKRTPFSHCSQGLKKALLDTIDTVKKMWKPTAEKWIHPLKAKRQICQAWTDQPKTPDQRSSAPRTLQVSPISPRTCMLEVEGFSEPWLNAAETQEPLFAWWPGDLHRWHLSCLSWLSAQEQWECESGSGYAAPHLVATTPTSSSLACASQGAPRRQVRC